MITIRGPNTAPGQPVTLVAQTIVFEANAGINTTGSDGKSYTPGDKLLPDQTPGHNGASPGQPGADGADGGNVTIVAQNIQGLVSVMARGGRGGRGRDGQDGSVGPAYSGPPVKISYDRHGEPLPHGPLPPGGKGGDAGPAGSPGKSGTGGSILITVTDPASLSLDHVDNSGGPPPQLATPGRPGFGGPGPRYGPYGANAPIPSPATAGANGTLKATRLTDTDFAAACSVQQMRKILAAAEFEYLNNNLTTALPRFAWVSQFARLMTS